MLMYFFFLKLFGKIYVLVKKPVKNMICTVSVNMLLTQQPESNIIKVSGRDRERPAMGYYARKTFFQDLSQLHGELSLISSYTFCPHSLSITF